MRIKHYYTSNLLSEVIITTCVAYITGPIEAVRNAERHESHELLPIWDAVLQWRLVSRFRQPDKSHDGLAAVRDGE